MKQLTTLFIAALLGGMFALGGSLILSPETSKVETIEQERFGKLANFNTGRIQNAPIDFVKAAEIGMPAVVHIAAKQTQARNAPSGYDKNLDDIFRDFMNPLGGAPSPRQGTGSGVIVDQYGYIVTNNHVVEFADEFEVTLFDKRKFNAQLVGTDPTTDLAVLKIEGNMLPTLNYGNSDKAKVGEWVLAVGNPFDLTSTVTAGIISAKGRNIDILGGGSAIESFIQTDAVVNPGNSGGALIDVDGNLIGINTAIKTRTGSYAGYSFAVPSSIVQKIVEDLITHGSAQRGFLGINIDDLDDDTAKELGLNFSEGVYVVSLVSSGSAIKAGVLPGDVITGVNGVNVTSAPELQEQVGTKRPGDIVLLDVNRRGKEKTIKVLLKAMDQK